MIYKATILFFLIGSIWAQEKSISGSTRRNRFSAGKSQAVDFNCPEDFGYYSHPSDCSQYYVCVFGGALLESCTGGLMYSTELQTCDWPRNVVCQTSTGPGVSTVKITDPRTKSRNTNTNAIHSATESLTSSSSILSRGIDNTIRTRQTPKSQGTSKSIFDDPSKGRQGRFLSNQGNDPQRIDNGFQAQETSSRAFNVVPSAPAPKVKFPPSLPGTSSGNRFSPARSSTKSPPQDSLYQDLLNLNDTDYYYYYDDILYDDYYDANSAKNKPTTTTTTASPFVRSRTPARSRGKASSKKSVSQSSLPSSSLTSRGRDSSRSSVSNTFKSPSSLKSNNPTSSFSSFPNAFSPSRSTGSKRGSSTSSTSKAGRKTQASSSKSAPRGSSRSKPKASSGSPKVVGRTPQRPNPLYPQPQVDVTAAPCDKTTCKLPDCYCGGRDIPEGLKPSSVPQLVLLTFDDAVNDLNKGLYRDLFERGRVNPNGCPIAATFYVSHEWTDYTQVQNLYADGHEIASHSVTHMQLNRQDKARKSLRDNRSAQNGRFQPFAFFLSDVNKCIDVSLD